MVNPIKQLYLNSLSEVDREMFEAKSLYKERDYSKIKWCPSCKKVHLAQYKICPKCKEELSSIEEKHKYEEYRRQLEEKMSELSRQAVEKEFRLKQSGYHGMAECPYCHSRDTREISTTSKVASAAMLGIASNKIGKQWHCNNCKSDF